MKKNKSEKQLVEIKRYHGRHLFERYVTDSPFTIASVLKDYMFVKSVTLAEGAIIRFMYRHKYYDQETLVLTYV